MSDSVETKQNNESEPHCQHFVVRKKRLCRMTVRPGQRYCGEHEPQPRDHGGQKDTRVPCPLDPKHTCYASKLNKHLLICNARPRKEPPYIVHNINAPAEEEPCERRPLGEYSKEMVAQVIDKVNHLYDKYIKDQITSIPEQDIHSSVLQEYSAPDRADSSRRHLRQTSALLRLAEGEGLVRDNTCYVELGAGKGQLSYYACVSWCAAGSGSRVLVVDRSALRHKRDNRAGCDNALRLRADLAHLALQHVPEVAASEAAVGLAKHLCGVATDYALRSMTSAQMLSRTRGAVVATCCHHRCARDGYTANQILHELGITADDFNIMLGIVSWATCGDGRSRDRRAGTTHDTTHDTTDDGPSRKRRNSMRSDKQHSEETETHSTTIDENNVKNSISNNNNNLGLTIEDNRGIGLDKTSVTSENGTLTNCRKVDNTMADCDSNVNDNNTCTESSIVPHAKTLDTTSAGNNDTTATSHTTDNALAISKEPSNLDLQSASKNDTITTTLTTYNTPANSRERAGLAPQGVSNNETITATHTSDNTVAMSSDDHTTIAQSASNIETTAALHRSDNSMAMSLLERAAVGRRAKAVVDWGRVLHLRSRGLSARLCRYVPDHVSPENIAIVASRPL